MPLEITKNKGEKNLPELLKICPVGARYWVRTSDPRRVKAVLYR